MSWMENSKAEKGKEMGCNPKWSGQGCELRIWHLNKDRGKQGNNQLCVSMKDIPSKENIIWV